MNFAKIFRYDSVPHSLARRNRHNSGRMGGIVPSTLSLALGQTPGEG
ncbi:MAG: hypothetical protein P4L49_12780 [Desulfosporosinus sp.]|nr:hypothetical protein [Desulfosporosinus sp.]